MALLLAATILSGCVSQDESSLATPSGNASDRIKVATTIAPLGDFVKAVGGEKVEVTVVVPPGAEPHTFEPTPSLMMDVAKADLYVMNGAGLEFWMDKLLEANKRMVVVDSSQGIALLQESEDEIDPHIWLSLRNAAVQVNNICSGLIEVDPQNKDYLYQEPGRLFRKAKSPGRRTEPGPLPAKRTRSSLCTIPPGPTLPGTTTYPRCRSWRTRKSPAPNTWER